MSTTVSHGEPTVARSHSGAGPDTACTLEDQITRSLLGYGVVAGPFYVLVSLTQALIRERYDLFRHDWSLLANGTGGWVQVANLKVVRLPLEHCRQVRLHVVPGQVARTTKQSVLDKEVAERATNPHLRVDGGRADVSGAKVNLPMP